MPVKSRSTKEGKKKPGTAKKVEARKTSPARTQTVKSSPAKPLVAPLKTPSAETLKKTITYFYLLSFCPLEQLNGFKRSTAALRKNLAEQAGINEEAYFTQALPEACRRIVAYSQATREPDQAQVEALVKAAQAADKNPDALAAFKSQMALVAALPGRARPENRLHRKKGCQFCRLPCQYGYFTLVSEPNFAGLQALFEAETGKPADKRSPLLPVYLFAVDHLRKVSGGEEGYCEPTHLANLAFCLLLLGTAKSRMAMPEKQLRIFQEANQEFLRRREG